MVAPDLQAPEPSITWIGHSTVLARLGGLAVLTDPQFSERASPVSWAGPKRVGALPLTPAQLPHIDVVLVSHNHYDHLDEASVRALAAQPGWYRDMYRYQQLEAALDDVPQEDEEVAGA